MKSPTPRFVRLTVALLSVLLAVTLAQESNLAERIITITYDGGNRTSPNLRFGPYNYTHPEPEGIVANVSNLTIYASEAQLRAPEGVLIAEAEGEREASFENGVRVERGRLTAVGPGLVYSEATGLGLLARPANIVVRPRDENEEPAEISAQQVTFDVDTDTSVSRGDVELVNGRQQAQADELLFEQGRDLAVLSSEGEQVTAQRQEDEGELVINADELRVLTEEDQLLATGNVTIIDGNIQSSGAVVYFNDETSRAEILGTPDTPAISREFNDAGEVIFEISGPRIEQRTDIDAVSLIDASIPVSFDESAFELSEDVVTP